ncbi:Aspartyl protease [Plasmopara halstedii]|uniref:Aspartyl protease n=1 Tax=Plasmopara halstedii TaxID=4781 RepID=A0A0P1AI13_PLAHL|nr:Aspartyl protease [Plasmopara halstedii]CEG40631.1 Aspartyl protease [Plasmopara halstedii]|eukprot:XP_024577000.1 Aspartyl protease [Plasmopara halstedii]
MRHFVRIPLQSRNQLQFTGILSLQSPSCSVRVIFDTGSSDSWIFRPIDTNSNDQRSENFFGIKYGGGIVSGFATVTNVHFGSPRLFLYDVLLGFVTDETLNLLPLDIQGVVGLGMEALAQFSNNLGFLSRLEQHERPFIFSFFISSSTNAQPSSQLIIGGDDPALASINTTWITFPVVSTTQLYSRESTRDEHNWGFWIVQYNYLTFNESTLSFNGFALLDSGTSLLLLPLSTFNSVVQMLSAYFGTRFYLNTNWKQSLPACRRCMVNDFPLITFHIVVSENISQQIELHGSDYVRCDPHRHECTALIDTIHPSEFPHQMNVMILGTLFFRAYYTRFDYSNKQVSLACILDSPTICRGGLHQALDYSGQLIEPKHEIQQSSRQILTGVYAAITALVLLAGIRGFLYTLSKRKFKHIHNS